MKLKPSLFLCVFVRQCICERRIKKTTITVTLIDCERMHVEVCKWSRHWFTCSFKSDVINHVDATELVHKEMSFRLCGHTLAPVNTIQIKTKLNVNTVGKWLLWEHTVRCVCVWWWVRERRCGCAAHECSIWATVGQKMNAPAPSEPSKALVFCLPEYGDEVSSEASYNFALELWSSLSCADKVEDEAGGLRRSSLW